MKKIFIVMISMVMVVAFFVGQAVSAQQGKIAVAAEGNSDTAMVSAVAARAPFFLIFDGDGKFLEAIANPHKDAGGNTSALVTKLLVSKGITAAIAGQFGGKMMEALQNNGIVHFEQKGKNAKEAVKKYLKRDLAQAPKRDTLFKNCHADENRRTFLS
jgi:predicted Fe-Mo cluster-binding NifX family protein